MALSDDQITQIRERLQLRHSTGFFLRDDVDKLLALVDQLRSERDANWADLCEVKAGTGVVPKALYDAAMKRAAQAEAKQLELIRMETEQYDRAYKLEAALARLRTALEFYAGLGMAELHSGDREPGEFIQDLGATARAALASTRPAALDQQE